MHLALQHVEAAVNVGGDADCTADVSMAALHLLLQKAYVISQHLNMPAQQLVAVMWNTYCTRPAVSGCHVPCTSLHIVIILGFPLQPRHFWTDRTECSMGRLVPTLLLPQSPLVSLYMTSESSHDAG